MRVGGGIIPHEGRYMRILLDAKDLINIAEKGRPVGGGFLPCPICRQSSSQFILDYRAFPDVR